MATTSYFQDIVIITLSQANIAKVIAKLKSKRTSLCVSGSTSRFRDAMS